MATISQDEVRLLINNTLTRMRDRVEVGLLSSTMLKHELKVCANRIDELGELLGNDDKVRVVGAPLTAADTGRPNPPKVCVSCSTLGITRSICTYCAHLYNNSVGAQAVDELFTQKGV